MLVTGARVFDLEDDVDEPPVLDIPIEDGMIQEVAPRDPARQKVPGTALLEAGGLLAMPGFVNAHYHSYDTLVKGLTEDMPFDVWALHSLPAYLGPRSHEEMRVRTLIGAVDCLRHGITAVQDMMTLLPMNEETLDTTLAAYAEAGLRVSFAVSLRDEPSLDIAPFLPEDMPDAVRAMVTGGPNDHAAQIGFVEAQLARCRLSSRVSRALAASGPQQCSRKLLEGLADLSRRHDLPLFTHVYETKAQALKARRRYAEQGGSMIRAMAGLDVTTQKTMMDLVAELTRARGMSKILITCDFGLFVAYYDRVVVMRRGQVVEQGMAAEVFAALRHDYTRRLMRAMPRPGAACRTGYRKTAPGQPSKSSSTRKSAAPRFPACAKPGR